MLASALAACGDDDGSEDAASRLDAVEISGEFGASPTVDWKSRMTAGKPEVESLVKGEGAELKKGDKVYVNFWVGNGYTQEATFDTFGPESPASVITIGAPPAQPQTVEDVIGQFLTTEVKAGVTRGTRLAVTVGASDLFGQNVGAEPVAQADIGQDDSLLVIADVLDVEPLDKVEGKSTPAPAWAPEVVLKNGEPSGLDFRGTPALGDKLKVATLVEGTGEEVEEGDLLVANYLGVVYRGTKPFDESFTKPAPLERGIGLGQLVKGWDQGLVGKLVGSRVLLGIPPRLGYGKQGQPPTIPANATLFFVIDILGTV